jgi:RNA polymerase sigma-70 factor (ECF subfamily)
MVAGSPADDAALAEAIERARKGDGGAFGEIYRRLAPRVSGLCLHLLGSREEAEDATSEVFMRLRAALSRYDATLPFRPWLVGIATNHCLDRLRRRRREQRLFDAEPEALAAAPEPGPSPLAGLLAAERRAALTAAILALPERHRLPLVLRYSAEMSYDEIAKRLGWTRERVAVNLFRAKEGLRRALAGGDEER